MFELDDGTILDTKAIVAIDRVQTSGSSCWFTVYMHGGHKFTPTFPDSQKAQKTRDMLRTRLLNAAKPA